MLLTICWTVQIISGFLLISLVLLHSPKGDGLAGIGGAANLFSSQKTAEKGLNKLTMYVAIIFTVCSLLTGFQIFK